MECPEHLYGIYGEAVSHMAAVAIERNRPFMLLRPGLFQDGDQWTCLLGENMQTGVVAFGDSPDEATRNWDKAWYEKAQARKLLEGAPTVPSREAKLEEALRGLLDVQNGPPLARESDVAAWQAAVDTAEALLQGAPS